jgi:hypothetical protein
MSTDADKKFFALRNSGYTGPITEKGDKATNPDTLAILARLNQATTR